MNLQTIVDISQIAAALTVIGGTFFALMQLTEFRKQRREVVAGELMRTFMTPEFTDALTVVMRLPDNITAEGLRNFGVETEKAAVLVETTFETIGLLTFERITPFNLVLDLSGGTAVQMWSKLGAWIKDLRIESNMPSEGEWFQWLAEQCIDRKPKTAPAYVMHRTWTP